MLEQPAVLSEIRKIEDVVWPAFDQKGGQAGRHRRPGSVRKRNGASAPEVRPDPSAAQTPAEFVLELRKLKAFSGLSLRAIAAGAKQKRVHTTIQHAMKHETLPTIEVVSAIVTGCGGTEEDLLAFTAAWHRLNAASSGHTSTVRGLPSPDRTAGVCQPGDAGISAMLPAPVPALQMVH